jgi:hypothetical protein
MKKYNINSQGETKKRAHEGNISNNHNSFAILSNSKISALSGCMGVSILPDQYDVIDIMKDLEIARKVLDQSKKAEPKNPNDYIHYEEFKLVSEISALEWKDDDPETESFTLVQSKKKKSLTLLENLMKAPCIRRSKRSTPYVYRDRGGLEASPSMVQQHKKSLS